MMASVVGVTGQVTVNPFVGLTEDFRETVPVKLKMLLIVTGMEAPVPPELKPTGL